MEASGSSARCRASLESTFCTCRVEESCQESIQAAVIRDVLRSTDHAAAQASERREHARWMLRQGSAALLLRPHGQGLLRAQGGAAQGGASERCLRIGAAALERLKCGDDAQRGSRHTHEGARRQVYDLACRYATALANERRRLLTSSSGSA